MLNPIFLLLISFIGIYLNVWFLLLTFENKSKLHEKKRPKMLPKVSILIPAYNEAKTIGKTLKSVLRLDYPKHKLDVIEIDNGSTEATAEMVKKAMKTFKKFDKKLKLIRLKRPGKARALNAGLAHTKGELIGILDADTIVTKSCLKNMVGFFEDENIGAVTNHVHIDNPKGILGVMQNIEYIFSAFSKKLLSFINALYVTPGTLSLIRKDIIKEIKFSDDTLTEDMDIALCILKKKLKIANCLNAIAYTAIPKTLGELAKQRIRWYRGFIENTIKHSDVLFNKAHPHLGFFVLPFSSFMAIFIGILLTVMVFLNHLQDAIIFLRDLYYMPVYDQMSLAISGFLDPFKFFLEPYSLITYITILTGTFITLLVTFHLLKVKKRKVMLLIPIYFFLFYTLIMIFWAISIFMEVFKLKKRW